MKIRELATPAILLDTDQLKRNMERFHGAAMEHQKQIWPMTKTHKSTRIARMQLESGAAGFLCGTLDECEAFAALGAPIMYAYPPAGMRSLERVIRLAKGCELILRLDGEEGARAINAAAERAGLTIGYTVIVDAGLHRFGVAPEKIGDFVKSLARYENLRWRGISTHPGQVYTAEGPEEVGRYLQEERSAVDTALASLKAQGLVPEIVSSGATPTHEAMCADSALTVTHPGNYVFLDAIQMSMGIAKEEDCALRVLATVIAHPAEDRYIIDAGAKCLGLDQGAHGKSSVKGFGHIVGHPELTLYSLSEEVGKIHAEGNCTLEVGDQIQIIPNHSCSAANCTSLYMAVSGETVLGEIAVDVRGNSNTRL